MRKVLLNNDLFAEIDKQFDRKPSMPNLKSFLLKRGFKPDAALKAAQAYLDSLDFVEQYAIGYNNDVDDDNDNYESNQIDTIALSTGKALKPEKIKTQQPGEKELFSYKFEDNSEVRILISGDIETSKVLDTLSALINLKKIELSTHQKNNQHIETPSDVNISGDTTSFADY